MKTQTRFRASLDFHTVHRIYGRRLSRLNCACGLLTLLLLSVFTDAFAQGGTLVNGAFQTGTLASGASDSWTFSANAGDALVVRAGAAIFSPRLQLFGPDHASLAEVSSANGATHDVFLTNRAPSSGTFTVLVSSTFNGGTGAYSVSLAQAPEAPVISVGDEGGLLKNGGSNPGTIALGDLDVWNFSANAGDAIMLRAGSPGMSPWLRLYDPNGALVKDAPAANGATHDVFLTAQATNSGNYTVVISSTFANGTGAYGLSLAQAPGPISLSVGHAGGVLTNGLANQGTIALGDLDVWAFNANAGDSLMLRMGAGTFSPWIRLYGPNGALVQEAASANGAIHDVFMTLQATNAGTYTAVVSSTFANGTGDYTFSLAQAPEPFSVSAGDEGGVLQNGAAATGTIALGDLDMWSFTANAGDGIMLRVGSTTSPWLRLYGPDGALVQEAASANGAIHDVFMDLTATNSGSYTVVVSSTFANGTGDYTLSLAQSPEPFIVSAGDQSGTITNGVTVSGTLALGDLDMWSFQAAAGDGIMLRAGSANAVNPQLRVYGPTGALVAQASAANGALHDTELSLQATNDGTYTVVVDNTFANGSGDYTLSLAQALEPVSVVAGQPGGPLTDGLTNNATLNIGGLDVWSFYGTPGDSNVLRVAAPNFSPAIDVYGPDGSLVKEVKAANGAIHNVELTQVITNAGNYVAVVSSAFLNGSGAYTLKQVRVPPDLVVPPTQVFDEGGTLNVAISAQDPDAPAKPLVFNLISGPPALTMALGPATNATLTWVTTEADGPSTNVVVVSVTDTVNGHAFTRTNSFTVVVNEVNTAPKLTVPAATQNIDEGAPLNLSASATDIDLPPNPLTFSLLNPPSGMTIDPNTGAIAWTPTEAQGPSTNLITVIVTDSSPSAVNAQHLSDTNTFTVVVNEINTPPQLTLPPDQHVRELTPFNATVVGTDADLPPNPLTYALVNPPSEMTIDPNSGAISWTPTEAQGPSTNVITVTVTDSNPAAVNNQHLSTTGSFTLIVDEVNTPPQLTVPADQVLNGLVPLQASASATDSDLPANPLTFSLVAPPSGMQINPTTGAITWTPTASQAPSTNTITVVVTDSNPAAVNEQQLSATNSFKVVVHANTAPTLQPISNQPVHFGNLLTVQAVGADSDLPAQTLTYSLDQAPTNMTINATTGLISWTPTEAQIGTTNVTVRVTDNGVPPMSATTTFQVTVSGAEWSLAVQPVAGGLMQITIIGDTTFKYELQKSSDLVNWETLVQQTGPKYIDPDSATTPIRFYRLKLTPP